MALEDRAGETEIEAEVEYKQRGVCTKCQVGWDQKVREWGASGSMSSVWSVAPSRCRFNVPLIDIDMDGA